MRNKTPSIDQFVERARGLSESEILSLMAKLRAILRERVQENQPEFRFPRADEEVTELTIVTPLSNREIVEGGYAGGWEHLGISDPVEWKKEQQRMRRRRHQW